MYNIIERYMNIIKKEDIQNFALKKNVQLSQEELDFTYLFIKKNWKEIIQNPAIFDIDRYKNNYSSENFPKIKQVYKEYFQKFGSLL